MRKKSPIVPVAAVAVLLLATDWALAQENGPLKRRLSFGGMADADFASEYGTFGKARHVSGIEIDLATRASFSPSLNAEVRTTMRDGTVPGQGAGNTWAPLEYDGAQINWNVGRETILMAGDLVAGSGYFTYYRYKRAAVVVGEHTARGAGLLHGNILVQAGAAADTAGAAGNWSLYAQWKRPINASMAWITALRYSAGGRGITPFEFGLSFEGSFEEQLDLRAHAAMHYWNGSRDPGLTLLIEPRYTFDRYFAAATLFLSDKGEVPSPNAPRHTVTAVPLDDFLLQFEPGLDLNGTFAAGLSLEFRNVSFNAARDESLWMVPVLHVYPAPRAEWRVWSGIAKPLLAGSAGNPQFSLGSEILFTF